MMIRRLGYILIACSFPLCGMPLDSRAQESPPRKPDFSLSGGTSALCPTPDQYSPSRPDAGAGPTRVKLGLYFADIMKLDDAQQFYTADVFLITQWRDPRLANPARGETSSVCQLPRDKVWFPAVQFNRIRGLDQYDADITMVDREGTVTYVQRSNIDVSVNLDLGDFPFDKHTLTLEADPVFASADEIEFDVLEALTGRADLLSLNGWKIGKPYAEVKTENARARNITISRYLLHLDVEREWNFYVWRTIVPLIFIVFMSCAVFWIPPTQFVRIGLSATSMLTLIAYQFAFTNLLPKISYLTRSDRFATCSSILIFLALVEAVTTSALAHHGKTETAVHIDHLARWIFPLAFLGVILFAFVV